MNNTPHAADTLVELLEQQQGLVQELGHLARRQAALIEAGRTDALLELLAQRQQIMDRFVSSQDSLAELTESMRGGGGHVAEERRERVSTLVDSISRDLSEILHRDEQDRAALRANRDRTADQLTGLGTAKQAHQAYFKARAVNNRFADRQG
ncbi:MAG: flagellar export chaperone FlgN [Planctomycetota bacterium]